LLTLSVVRGQWSVAIHYSLFIIDHSTSRTLSAKSEERQLMSGLLPLIALLLQRSTGYGLQCRWLCQKKLSILLASRYYDAPNGA
jgi:hypothetical protein